MLKNSPTSNIQVKQNKNVAGQYLYAYNQQEVPQVIERHLAHTPFVNEQKMDSPNVVIRNLNSEFNYYLKKEYMNNSSVKLIFIISDGPNTYS